MQSISYSVASVCPLCGKANHCNIARNGIVEDCWCYKQQLNVATLERVTPSMREQACVCPQCAIPVSQTQSNSQ